MTYTFKDVAIPERQTGHKSIWRPLLLSLVPGTAKQVFGLTKASNTKAYIWHAAAKLGLKVSIKVLDETTLIVWLREAK